MSDNSLFRNTIYLDDVPKEQLINYIGEGYRSVCYAVDNERRGQIILFGYDKTDNPATFIFPWKSHVKYAVKWNTHEQDIYDRPVATKEFNNIYERKKWVDSNTGLIIVELLRPEQEVLHYLFDNAVLNDNFNKQPLRIHYFDIETEISDVFEKPADARNRINMMTIYDTKTEKFYTWALQDAEINFVEEPLCNYPKSKFVYYNFNNNEEKMLEHFLDWQEENYADVNFGWNTRAYDIPYLTRRIENVLGKGAAQRLSPVKKYYIKQVNHDNARADVAAEIEVNIDGLFTADGLVLYRDKFGISKPDGGFTLDNIGEVEGLGHKIKYEGTLKDLYLKDWQKFYEYNVRDVDLVKRIEEKCKMVPLARTITSFGLSQYPTIYSSISYLIGSVISFAKTQMNRVMVSHLGDRKNFDGFEGAFVFPTQKGRYTGGIGCIDFASLYPSIIRSLNISPETYRGKVLIQYKSPDGHSLLPINEKNELPFNIFDDKEAKADNVAGYYLKLPDNRRKKVTLETLRNFVDKHGIYTTNNTIFLKHEEKWGVISKWCEYFYNQRKATKKKMLQIFRDLHDDSKTFSKKEKKRLEDEAENLNSRQGAFKNMINSIYGQMGSSYSPIANLDIAQTVTRLGRACNTYASNFVLKSFQEKYDPTYQGYRISTLEDDDPRRDKAGKVDVIAVGGDTDSQFINLQVVTDYMKKHDGLPEKIRDWPQEKRQELWDTINDFVNKDVNEFVRNMVHNYTKTNQQNVLTYELEYMADCGLYESKKHYFVHKIFEEGVAVDKIKVTGIALKKNETDKSMKSVLQDIYEGAVLKDWNETNYQDYISNIYETFKTLSIDQIAFWKGYNTAREAVGFLTMGVGTTGIAKACTYYNQILEKLNLTKKYDQILVGNKTRFVYLKSTNEYGIDCIAYLPGSWPKEFDNIFEVDYPKMFDKIILDQLKRYREACRFSDFDPKKQVMQDIFAL